MSRSPVFLQFWTKITGLEKNGLSHPGQHSQFENRLAHVESTLNEFAMRPFVNRQGEFQRKNEEIVADVENSF